jgi:polyisoprenoid-binding protein YceI
MNTRIATPADGTRSIERTAWRIDPARSSVEFAVPSLWGLTTVKGRFTRYHGTLDLRREPAVALTLDADSVDTGNARRDKHLRSADFFAVEQHPHVLFRSDAARLEGERLTITGTLSAAGTGEPLRLVATLWRAGEELEIEAATELDQRRLGMKLRVLGAVGVPSRLTVRGRLVPEAAAG